MLDWDDLRSFLAVARYRTLSAAARALHVQQSTMGRRLEAFEERAGVVLLQKTPGGFVLTEAGEAVLGHVERIEQEALAIERAIAGRDTRLEGAIRLTATETMAVDVLTPILTGFLARYPGITLELVADLRTLSLSKREADIAVRVGRPEGHELVARKVGEVSYGIYASPAYLARMGAPDFGAGAPGHRAIMAMEERLGVADMAWTTRMLSGAAVALRTDSRYAHVAAAEAGVGLAGIAHYLAEGRDLVRLQTPEPPRREVWLAVHEDLRRTPRIRALMDVLATGLQAQSRRLLGE